MLSHQINKNNQQTSTSSNVILPVYYADHKISRSNIKISSYFLCAHYIKASDSVTYNNKMSSAGDCPRLFAPDIIHPPLTLSHSSPVLPPFSPVRPHYPPPPPIDRHSTPWLPRTRAGFA